MMSYSQKLPTKCILLALACAFLAILILTLSADFFLSQSRDKIENRFAEKLGYKINIEHLYYLAPNAIVLKKVSLSERSNKPFVSIPKIKFNFSLARLIFKKSFVLTNITFYSPRADYFICRTILEKNFKRIMFFLVALPKSKEFGFIFRKAQLEFPRAEGFNRQVIFDNALRIKGDRIYNQGEIYLGPIPAGQGNSKHREFSDDPLGYRLQGKFTEEGLIVEKLRFRRGPFSMKLWGSYQQQVISLSGIVTLRNFFEAEVRQNLPVSIGDKLKHLLHKLKSRPSIAWSPASNLNVYDFSCVLSLNFPVLKIETLEFSLRDTPLRLQGNITFLEPISFDLFFSTFPESTQTNDPRHCEITVSGALKRNAFSGKTNVKFMRTKGSSSKVEEISSVFKNLILTYSDNDRSNFFAKRVDVTYSRENNIHELSFDDFHLILTNEGRVKNLEFTSGLYDGSLQGRSYLDITKFPLGYELSFELRNVSSEKLTPLSVYFSKIHGSLASTIWLGNYPQFRMQGNMLVEGGYLIDVDFFKWLARFFKLPELARIDFEKTSADFLVTNEIAQLQNINLVSPDTKIEGYFHLLEEELVSSKLSFSLSKEVLSKSPKFKSLVRLIGKDFSDLTFDFQLSGLFEDMNFKWMDSYFKKRLRSSIPDFIERGIERKIEDIGIDNP